MASRKQRLSPNAGGFLLLTVRIFLPLFKSLAVFRQGVISCVLSFIHFAVWHARKLRVGGTRHSVRASHESGDRSCIRASEHTPLNAAVNSIELRPLW